jgi:hypothetical protein
MPEFAVVGTEPISFKPKANSSRLDQRSSRPDGRSSNLKQTHPGWMNVHPGWIDVHPGWIDVHPGWIDVHPGWIDVHPGWVDVHPGWIDVHPGWIDVHPGWVDVHPGWIDVHPGWIDVHPGWIDVYPGWIDVHPGRSEFIRVEANSFSAQPERSEGSLEPFRGMIGRKSRPLDCHPERSERDPCRDTLNEPDREVPRFARDDRVGSPALHDWRFASSAPVTPRRQETAVIPDDTRMTLCARAQRACEKCGLT